MKLGKRSQAGDTIVEVLLAVAVLGLAIAVSYSVSTLALKQSRQAQERSEALKLAETQLESLKALATQGNSAINQAGVFCLQDTATPRVNFPAGYGATIQSMSTDGLNFYPAACVRDSSNTATSGGLYHIAVEGTALSNGRRQFSVAVRWFSLSGIGKDEVRVEYRVVQ